jgi:hypothetical protein
VITMTEKTDKLLELPRKPPPLPRRPSYETVLENIEKWASSSGLQKPK